LQKSSLPNLLILLSDVVGINFACEERAPTAELPAAVAALK